VSDWLIETVRRGSETFTLIMGDIHYYAPQTETNNSLSADYNTPDGVLEKRMKVLAAYSRLGSELEQRKQAHDKTVKNANRIRPIDRFKYHKEGKFDHSSTALINGQGKKPKVDHSNWWAKGGTEAGEKMNSAQDRCSRVSSYTGSIAHNHRWNKWLAAMRGEEVDREEGEGHGYGTDAFKFISKSNVDKIEVHSSIQRQEDFLAEATFRSSLRH
jgi:hypothetical protein